jgi:hypothetical protein
MTFWLLALCVATVFATAATAYAKPASIPFQCQESDPDDVQIMIDIDSAFGYKHNSWQTPIGRLIKFQCYKALGRDATEFTLFQFGDSQAWVSRTAVRFRSGFDWTQLPLLDLSKVNTTAAPLKLPAGAPNIGKDLKKIYSAAAKNGRDPKIVSVMGDCNSEWPVYFGRIATGTTNLSLHPKLAKTVQHFAPSFVRISQATQGSFTSQMAFDPSWSNPKMCTPNEGPLDCELRTSKASIMLIALGTGDTFSWQSFDENLRQIVETTRRYKAIPVLITKADALEWHQGGASTDYINKIIRSVGAQYGVPVIDFALAAKSLPNAGLMVEHDETAQQTEPFHLNQQGMDARILLTLQTLNAISGK